MRKILGLLALLALLPGVSSAQQRGEKVLPLVSLYDLDATTATYCVTLGQGAEAGADWYAVGTLITTSGSSTTVAAVTASSGPFTDVAVGDELEITVGLSTYFRVVTARASADSITVDSAISLPSAGVYFHYRTRSCGTAATSGWFPVKSYSFMTVFLQVTQIAVTGQIDFKVQCRSSGVDSTPIEVYSTLTSNYRSGGYDTAQVDNDAIGVDLRLIQATDCRVGMYIDSADDGNDLTTNLEQVTVKVGLR